MVGNKCFIGEEAEGPDKGKMTLFIPGGTSPEQFVDVCRKLSGTDVKIENIYYGAGDDRELRIDTLREILKCTDNKLWCEFEDSNGDIFVIHHQTGDLFKKVVSPVYILWIPLVSKGIISKNEHIVTTADNKHFLTDKEV